MNSHMFFTVHIYQYRVDKNSKNAGGGKKIYDTCLVEILLFTVSDLHDKLRPPSIQTRYLVHEVLRFS